MDDQYSDPSLNDLEQKLIRSLSDYLSGTNDQPTLDQDSAPTKSDTASEGDERPDASEASANDAPGASNIGQALRHSHNQCLIKLLAEPTADGWMTYQESFKNHKRFIASIESSTYKSVCHRELYKQAHDAFIKYFSDKAKSFEVTPGMSRALCGRAYLDQPYMLSQAEAAYLHAAKFPLDESPSLFKVL